MSNAPVVGDPPKKPSWSWVVWIVIAFAACVPVLGIVTALAIYGVRKYVLTAKHAEGRAVVAQLAAGVARCTTARASSGIATLPATSDPVPRMLTEVGGRKYMSAATDWNGDAYSCAGFAMRDPQYFQYQWEKLSDTEGRATARADLDGDMAAEIEFEVSVRCSGSQCTAGPVNAR